MQKNQLIIRGAREHNLKNVDLEIPRDKLIVFTGLSGSGKSSLALGVLFVSSIVRFYSMVRRHLRRKEGAPPA